MHFLVTVVSRRHRQEHSALTAQQEMAQMQETLASIAHLIETRAVRGCAALSRQHFTGRVYVQAALTVRQALSEDTEAQREALRNDLRGVLPAAPHVRIDVQQPAQPYAELEAYMARDCERFLAHPDAERRRAQRRWRRVRRHARAVGRIATALRSVYVEVVEAHYRPGGRGARIARAHFEALVHVTAELD